MPQPNSTRIPCGLRHVERAQVLEDDITFQEPAHYEYERADRDIWTQNTCGTGSQSRTTLHLTNRASTEETENIAEAL